MGGTEVLARWFHENILPCAEKFYSYNCILIPGEMPSPQELMKKKNIFWLHAFPNDLFYPANEIIVSKEFIDLIEYLIVGSEFHKKKVLEVMDIDPKKVIVIEYYVENIPYDENKYTNIDKIKIIHVSDPARGMPFLLKSLQYIQEDFELNIYNNFYPELDKNKEWYKFYDRLKLDKIIDDDRINFYGRTPRKTVLKKFSESHIHAYPTIVEEIVCMSQIESIIAGCYPVYSNVGALPETSMNFGAICNFSKNYIENIENFGILLNQTIVNIKNKKFNNHKEQSIKMSQHHSFEKIKNQWLEFHKII